MRRIKVPISELSDHVELFNGIFGLTDSEIEVLTEFIRVELTLKNNGVDRNPFETEFKKRVADRLNRDDFNTLNTYIKRLKDKSAIKPTNNGYKINSILVPTSDNEILIQTV